MNLSVSFRHVASSPAVVTRLERRARRFTQRFDPQAHIGVVCSQEPHGATVDVRARVAGAQHVVRGRAADLYTAVDDAFDRLRTRARRRAAKRKRRRRAALATAA